MTKKHRHHGKPGFLQNLVRTASPAATPKAPETTDQIESLHTLALEHATVEQITRIERTEPPSQVNLLESWRKADEARQLFELQLQEAEKARLEAEEVRGKTNQLRQELEGERAELQAGQRQSEETEKQLTAERSTLDELQNQLLDRERKVRARELNAEAGFAAQNRAALAELEREAAQLKQQLSDLHQQLVDERDRFDETLAQERKSYTETQRRVQVDREAEWVAKCEAEERRIAVDLQKRRDQLDVEQKSLEEQLRTLAEQRRQLAREKTRLEDDREMLKQDQAALEQKVERLASARVEQAQSQLQTALELLKVARADRDNLRGLLAKHEEINRHASGRSATELWDELQRVTRERDELRQMLAARPSEADVQRLEALEKEREMWETDRARLQRELQEAKRHSAYYQIGVVELETLRDQKAALEASRSLLSKRLEELRNDIQIQLSQDTSHQVFPACDKLDQDPAYQEVPDTDQDTVRDLKTFVERLQHWMAYDPENPQKKLYYELADIRSFLAGLAMSQLAILQGVSGTGKTSLPLAFARAVSGSNSLPGNMLIEVQAGWRDRQDLVGHYNSFEGKFYESRFLQAIYIAQCPALRDRLFFVILDEMNLSYPEQYFADLLSALESPKESERRINLVTQRVDDAPKLFLDHGRALHIPSNMWFVGTANQDETTKDFAPKTYDRAHIMELPLKHVPFSVDTRRPAPLISFGSLKQVFDDAKTRYGVSSQ